MMFNVKNLFRGEGGEKPSRRVWIAAAILALLLVFYWRTLLFLAALIVVLRLLWPMRAQIMAWIRKVLFP